MATLCIFIDVNAEDILMNCTDYEKQEDLKYKTYRFGYVCTKTWCDWRVDPSCKNGTWSKVLLWETDIFEIGFEPVQYRPTEILLRIDLNYDYYLEIKVISDKEKRTGKVILNECSHKEKTCLESLNFPPHNLHGIAKTFVAIGFRKDKKMNFVARGDFLRIATDLFGPGNEYEFKKPGFYFNTNETMKISVYSNYDENYEYNGLLITLPTSVGGFFFNEFGYLTNEKDYFCTWYYQNQNEEEGLPYIIKEYFKNSENWKAPPVKWTLEKKVPYYDQNGMIFKPEQMKIKEAPNPNFDAEKMIRKVCYYLEKPNIDTEPDFTETATTTESTSTEEETTETTTTTLTETTEPEDLMQKSASTPEIKSFYEGEIRINQTIFIRKLNPSEKNMNLKEFIDSVGRGSLAEDYLKRVDKGVDDYEAILKNRTRVPLNNYQFKNPPKKRKKEEKKEEKKKGGSGGSGGAGDASRGQRQAKNISHKFIVIFILLILSVQ